MAAAAGPSILETIMVLRGAQNVVSQIRAGASQFDQLRASTERANDAINQIRSNQIFTGAPVAQIGALGAAFETAGIAAERLRDVAHDLRERLFRDPIAIGAFGRSVLPARLGGPQNEAQVLDEAIRMLRGITDAEQRLYMERKLGLEVLDPLIRLDKAHFDALEAEGKRRGALVDDELQGLRAIEDSQFQRTKDLREERGLQLDRLAMRSGNWMREHVWLPLQEFVSHTIFRVPSAQAAGRASGGMDAHTDALQQNTRALANLSENLANAGPRGKKAIPGAYDVGRGTNLSEALATGQLKLGGFIQ